MKQTVKIGIVMFIVAVIIGFLLSKFWTTFEKLSRDTLTAQEEVMNMTVINSKEEGKTREPVTAQTASLEEKIGPDTRLVLEKRFEDCKHTVIREVELPTEMVNLTYDDLKKQYPEWSVKEFSEDKVVLYRLADGLCDEHFVVRDENGVVVVYKLDENYNKSLYEKTDIYTEFLPDQDADRLAQGIYVYTISDLNKELENLE